MLTTFLQLTLNNILQIAETVRYPGKPSIQPLSMTAFPLNDNHTTYRGAFVAPLDTKCTFRGDMIDVTRGLSLYKLS